MYKYFLVLFLSIIFLTASDNSSSDNCCFNNNINFEKETEKSSNSDQELIKYLIDKQDKSFENEKNNLKRYYDFINNGFIYNERFIYFVGSILVFIGFLILVCAVILGLWQRNKINTFEEEFQELKKLNSTYISNIKLEFNAYKELTKDMESQYVNLQTGNDNVKNLENTLMELISEVENIKNGITPKTQVTSNKPNLVNTVKSNSLVRKKRNPFPTKKDV